MRSFVQTLCEVVQDKRSRHGNVRAGVWRYWRSGYQPSHLQSWKERDFRL